MVLAKISCKMDQTVCRQSKVYQLYVKLPFTEVISEKKLHFHREINISVQLFCPKPIKLFKSLNEFKQEP